MSAIVDINEYEIVKDDPKFQVIATKMTWFNLGNIPVFVGLIPVMPGDVYQVNYEHPHVIKRTFGIRFDTTATPSTVAERAAFGLQNAPYLVLQTATPA